MKRRAGLTTVLCVLAGLGSAAGAETTPAQKGVDMTARASGTFEVKVQPLPSDEKVEGLTVGRMTVRKQWKGDIEGASVGEMMTAGTPVEGSAGYVAVEKVTGKLKGRSGSFTLVHQGTMTRGAGFVLTILVVPDSGTEQLEGLTGRMRIIIEGGVHSYEFDYALPDASPKP